MDELERAWAGTDQADEAVVRDLSGRIRDILRRKNLEAHLEVGQLLLDRCYGARVDRFGESATVDAIAREPDAPMSRASLYRSVQLLVQWRQMPEEIRANLKLSQHYALLQLPNDGMEKVPLAREAAAVGMKPAEIADRVRGLLGKPAPPTRKVPAAKAPAVGNATRMLAPWKKRMATVARPTPQEAVKVRRQVAELRGLLDELERWTQGV